MKRFFILGFMLLSTAVSAQQQPADPAFLQRAITALQAQRNAAMDAAAVADARAASLSDDLAKAQARVKELEPKPAADSPAK